MKVSMKVALLGLAIVIIAVMWYRSSRTTEPFQNVSEPTFTMYYADWCGHCKKAKPEFQQLVDKSPMDINGVKCNIRMVSAEKQPEIAKGKPIKGFPTFLMETPDGKTVEYKGSRSMDEYLKFINETLGNGGNIEGDSESAT